MPTSNVREMAENAAAENKWGDCHPVASAPLGRLGRPQNVTVPIEELAGAASVKDCCATVIFSRVKMADKFQMRAVLASTLCRCRVSSRGAHVGEGGPFVPSGGIGMCFLGACDRLSCLRVSVQDSPRRWQRLGL